MLDFSLKKTLLNDYGCFLMAITGPIFLVLSLLGGARGTLPAFRRAEQVPVSPEMALVGGTISLVLTVVLLFFLYRRIARIRRILRTGPRVQGAITDLSFHKDRGRVSFRYLAADRPIDSGAPIMKNRETLQLLPGTIVELALDPEAHEKAIVVELYVSPR